jgi:predicted small secreted protein
VRTALVVALLAAAVLLAACATSSEVEDLEARITELEQAAETVATSTTTATTRDITGSIVTKLGSANLVACYTRNNDRVRIGDTITIHDGSNAILAIDRLGNKTVNEGECTFTFTFPDVPTDQGFYRIRMGAVYWSFNRADLEADDWVLELTTGV